jgi:hypothetical protein
VPLAKRGGRTVGDIQKKERLFTKGSAGIGKLSVVWVSVGVANARDDLGQETLKE